MAPPTEVAAAFANLRLPNLENDREGYNRSLRCFIERWFAPLDSDLTKPEGDGLIGPIDVPWIQQLKDEEVRAWAEFLRESWNALCRIPAAQVSSLPEYHSLIHVDCPFVIPGARFREGYYWDSYWTIKGLLSCNMVDLAASVVSNLIDLATKLGHVPNGLRTYYINRSQPPLLAMMVGEIWNITKDRKFLRKALHALTLELNWWRRWPHGLCVAGSSGRKYYLSRYYAELEKPRPESYREDIETVASAGFGLLDDADEPRSSLSFDDLGERRTVHRSIFRNIASAAESGWDFSSRWFADGENLNTIRTTSILPADLNGLLYLAEKTSSKLAREAGDLKLSQLFSSFAEDRKAAIQELHWDQSAARWRDVVIDESSCLSHPNSDSPVEILGRSHCTSYASDWVPLWCGCADKDSGQALSAVQSLQMSSLVGKGGIAASNASSGQQWDWPNVWPPLQAMLAEGCELFGGEEGRKFAKTIAFKYLLSAYEGWKHTGCMFEKYDATDFGTPGGGGEYDVVVGFAWSNGVALSFLERYGCDFARKASQKS